MSRHRESAKLGTASKNLELDEAVEQEVDNVQVGNAASVIEFVRNFGSHYIASYTTGNSLYQVLKSVRKL